ncbi:tyrosine-type recombinase/integrase [Clostridium lacusfryxellense]|uniref:tyrosine-type recombinase/integrase n=1 Tax=Clostridium lacusfryxellense TaxID=205328 RepID=UPI001C0D477D|nr:tyrosine-type recombinase/integrase [Clostridium lacusfryxellense]MBU3111984.1 tyrosine-type recombinase/integrase [Clostridium lacusfryxellense]
MSIANNEVIIRMVGKLTLEFPDINQLKVREIIEDVLYKFDLVPQELGLVTSNDTIEKLQIYLVVKKLDGLSITTLKGYNSNLLIFANRLIKPLASITTMDLRMYLAQRCKKLMPTSTNEQIYILKSFFGWLNDEEYIITNPARKLKLTKEPVRLRQPLTEEQMEIFRQACITDRERAITEFLYSSACRLSDAVTISLEDINWEECTAVVIGKGNKEREIYFSIKAKILLKKYLKTRKGISNALFVGSKNPYSRLGGRSIEHEIATIKKRSGLGVNVFPHLFRHGKATDLSNSGTPIQIIKEILGHENISTTTIYAKVSKENIMHEYRRTS